MPAPVKEIQGGSMLQMAVSVSNVRVAYCRFHYCIQKRREDERLVGAGQQGKLTLLMKDEE